MNKDIEWAKKEIKELMTEESQNYPHDEMIEKEIVLGILNQLDEPEVLSQGWIDENSTYADFDGVTDEYVHVDDLKEMLVPKQELPVIPKFVAKYLELAKSEISLMRALEIANRRDELPKWEKEYDWISTNDEVFARAWLDGYTVEGEEKYCLKIGNLYLAEPLGDMTSDIVRMTRDKEIAYQFTDEKSIATHLDKFEGIKAVKVEEMEK